MASETLSKRSLVDQAADLMRRQIVDGTIPLGARLVETTLAARYGSSRGTIRAALRRLVDEGLVTQVPYAGYRAVDFSEHDLWELFTLRATLEALGARLAAQRIDEQRIARLREAFAELLRASETADAATTSQRDQDLHHLIIRLSGHGRLLQHYQRVENQFRAYIALANRDQRASDIAESHRALVEAICAGDAERAARLAEDNITPAPALDAGSMTDSADG